MHTTGNLKDFSDAAKAQGYAVDALCWSVDSGILSGNGNGILNSGGFASRAEVAAMLTRFVSATE